MNMLKVIQIGAESAVAADPRPLQVGARPTTRELIERIGDDLAAKGPCTRSTIPLSPRNPYLTVFGKVREGQTEQYLQWERERQAGLHEAPEEPCADPVADYVIDPFCDPIVYCRCGHAMSRHPSVCGLKIVPRAE